MIIAAQNEKEVKIIESLAKEIWTEHYTSVIGKAQVDYMLDKFQSKKVISKQINVEGFLYYIIQKDGKNIGYMGVQPRDNELFLSKLYMKSSERGKGYGKKAIQFVENFCKEKKLNKIALTVNKNNLNTIKAYEKMGFKNIASIIQDIGNGFFMDDYKMEKTV